VRPVASGFRVQHLERRRLSRGKFIDVMGVAYNAPDTEVSNSLTIGR
jgi:hypothetical protein